MRRDFSTWVLCVLLLGAGLAEASASYRSVLRRWSRHGEEYTFRNLESRLKWHATFMGPEFREGLRGKRGNLHAWGEGELAQAADRDLEELARYDEFLVAIYAGSSEWKEVGRDLDQTAILLQVSNRPAVKPISIEKVPIRQEERMLYPYLDRWSELFRVRFPRTIEEGKEFRLLIPGIPARSTLVWR